MSSPPWPTGSPGYSAPAFAPRGNAAPAWGAPPGFGPAPVQPGGYAPQGRAPQPAPPRRRSPLRPLLLGLVALTLVALAGLVAAGLTAKPAEVAYQNDQYQVPPPDASPPPLPMPQSLDEAKQWTTANAIYNQQMPAPVRCNLPRMQFKGASDNALKTHFEGLMECLVRAWYLPAQQAGFVLVRPTVTIYGEQVTGKCGKSGINAFYCSADQQVYYSRVIASRAPILEENPWAADVIIAHEFGHAIQARTGILYGYAIQANDASDKHEELLLSRRSETQADCFSGLFVRSVSLSIGLKQSDVPDILESYYQFGSDVLTGQANIESDHGLGVSRRYWGQTGLSNAAIGKCDTWTADKSLVR